MNTQLNKCDKCKNLGLSFFAEFIKPEEYIEGNPNGGIWIIGLNPKGNVLTEIKPEKRTLQEFADFDPDSYKYFKDFNKVSAELYSNWKSKGSIIAHTDIVKCFSQKFPPVLNDKSVDANVLISNCTEYLQKQIEKYKPKVLICNGTSVCREMMNIFPPSNINEPINSITSYKYIPSKLNKDQNAHSFWVVLSGFIGRVDDRNKRRLGIEIENILRIENIDLKAAHDSAGGA